MSSHPYDSRQATKPRRWLQITLAAAGLLWFAAANLLAASAARGITLRFGWDDAYRLLQAVFFLFLVALGIFVLHTVTPGRERGWSLRRLLGLPCRPSAGREGANGVAVGWAITVAAILPLALAGALHIRLWIAPRSIYLFALNLAAVALLSLASVIGLQGYAFRRLIEGVGPAWATVALSAVIGIAGTFHEDSTYSGLLAGSIFAALICLTWLRTHGLWMAWGLRFGVIASLGVVFGLPVTSLDGLSSVIETRAVGPVWLTGGPYGIESSPWSLLVLLAATAAVVMTTKDWAWDYTRKPLIPAGYPMDVPPPPAHVEMERQGSPPPPPLVQILPSTPQTRSATPEG